MELALLDTYLEIETEDEMEIELEAFNSIKPLSELKAGESGTIISVNRISLDSLRELARVGVFPFATIQVVANHVHHMIATIGDKRFATDKESASQIMVQLI